MTLLLLLLRLHSLRYVLLLLLLLFLPLFAFSCIPHAAFNFSPPPHTSFLVDSPPSIYQTPFSPLTYPTTILLLFLPFSTFSFFPPPRPPPPSPLPPTLSAVSPPHAISLQIPLPNFTSISFTLIPRYSHTTSDPFINIHHILISNLPLPSPLPSNLSPLRLLPRSPLSLLDSPLPSNLSSLSPPLSLSPL